VAVPGALEHAAVRNREGLTPTNFARLPAKRDAGLARLLERPVGEVVPGISNMEGSRNGGSGVDATTDAGDTPWGSGTRFLRDALAEEKHEDRRSVVSGNMGKRTIAVIALADPWVDEDNAFPEIGGRRRISWMQSKQWWATDAK